MSAKDEHMSAGDDGMDGRDPAKRPGDAAAEDPGAGSGGPATRALTERLERVWSRPPGFVGWLAAVNYRSIGLRYIVTAFVFFVLAGIQALVMRVQLARPEMELLSAEAFNQFFTMHGTTMMFLFAVPMMEGIGMYLVPMMIGARDMMFPRLNAFGYWVYLFAGITLYVSFFAGVAPHSGWFSYPPLSGPGFSPGPNLDVWVTAITFLEVAALVAAVELIVTILKGRAPGMSMGRAPLFVWAQLIMSIMIVFAMPPLILASIMLALDRMVGTHFFNAAAGGDPILWQHLFWIFGHPEVYIIFVPALGIVSTLLAVYARRPVIGYTLLVVSLVAIGFLSFGLWVHHMYATGLPLLGLNFFAAASMMIAIPSGVQIFCWIMTIWRGQLILNTSSLYLLGFLIMVLVGGLTGVMVASVPFDWQVHDTYFVVAHFHYILIGGSVLPLFAGFYHWFPKVTGRMLSERLGRWNFALFFIGLNVTFFPMHHLGFMGMPRRVYTYLDGLGWDGLNLMATVGAFIIAAGASIFVWNVVRSMKKGLPAPDDPWGGGTLEWSTPSPPPSHTFDRMPIVRGRYPLWEQEHLEPVDTTSEAAGLELFDPDRPERETLATTVLDAEPQFRRTLPGPSLWPLAAASALAIAFIGSMVELLLVPLGALLTYVAFLGWLWPRKEKES